MTEQPADPTGDVSPRTRRGPLRLLANTAKKAWDDNIFSEAAQAAFWQTLSLPPLLLGLLGSLGFLSDWLGPNLVDVVQHRIIAFCRTVFSSNVVDQIIQPTVSDILTKGQGGIVSVGFLISLWAGSSAMASFVDAITMAHNQYNVRNVVWQRIFALIMYLVGLIIAIVSLPLVAIGPGLLPKLFPVSWQDKVAELVANFYVPGTLLLLILALTTLYKAALPRKLPWHRGLPGAALAMVVFLLASTGLRFYIAAVSSTGYTYGALATPIAFLLFTFIIGFAIVLGAQFNNAVEQMWPARMTRRERRRWRQLELERYARRRQREAGVRAWQRAEDAETPPAPKSDLLDPAHAD
ncbi:YihY/virulence factor BrkB family protein [Pseudonocardiaceae bacterium YIM PH 21723]|nr:YihY/virulence factor BrkB family protein [Pseudonocardiaceae bacterium YIM PH 21723]